MDAAVLAGVLSYAALTVESAYLRAFFSVAATTTLLLEAFLLRTNHRALFIVPALLTLCIPLSTFRVPAYYSYDIYVFVATLSLELLVGNGLLAAFIYFFIVRPVRNRRRRRRTRVPIRPAQPVHPGAQAATAATRRTLASGDAASPPRELTDARAGPANIVTETTSSTPLRTAASPGEHPLARPVTRGRRRTITNSHKLAAKLFAESKARQPEAILQRRAERKRKEVQEDCKERLAEANQALELAKSAFKAEAEAAMEAVRRRDLKVRTVREEGGGENEEFDQETEALFEAAVVAEQRKKDALERLTAAKGALEDVTAWVRRSLEDVGAVGGQAQGDM